MFQKKQDSVPSTSNTGTITTRSSISTATIPAARSSSVSIIHIPTTIIISTTPVKIVVSPEITPAKPTTATTTAAVLAAAVGNSSCVTSKPSRNLLVRFLHEL
ncbi:hypothetical protein Hanom_Chr13g01239171 [Helianthus anomalus]